MRGVPSPPARVARRCTHGSAVSRFFFVGLRWSLRTLLINLLDDIPDTWPILVVSTWEGKPGNASNGEGGGALGGHGGHNMDFGAGGVHGTTEWMAVLCGAVVCCAAADDRK